MLSTFVKRIRAITLLTLVLTATASAETLSDQIKSAMVSNYPKCKVLKPLTFQNNGIPSNPMVTGSYKCSKNRMISLTLLLTTDPERMDFMRRIFYMRSINPPSREVTGIGNSPGMYTLNGRVELQFTKNNVIYRIDSEFPTNPNLKGPYYYSRAPVSEEEFVISLGKTIEAAGSGDRFVTPCDNNFAWPTVDYGVTTEAKLFEAIVKGDHLSAVQLIGLGADVEAEFKNDYSRGQNDRKNKPLHMAISKGCIETVRALIDAKASVNSLTTLNETPLMFAVATLDAELVRLLFEKGAVANVTTNYGLTAPFFVFQNYLARSKDISVEERLASLREIFTLLKANGLDLKKPESRDGKTLLISSIESCGGTSQCSEVIKLLLEEGIDINATDNYGQTVLYRAVTKINETAVAGVFEQLLAAGADPHIKTKDGDTVVSYLEKQSKVNEYHKTNFKPLLALIDRYAK